MTAFDANIHSAKVLIGHLKVLIVRQNWNKVKLSIYFKQNYFILEGNSPNIILIDQLMEFLTLDKDRYPHSVKSSRKYLGAKETPSLHLKYNEKGGNLR